MDLERISFSTDQLSDFATAQRKKGGERVFAYVFGSALVAAVVNGLLSNHLEGYEFIVAVTIMLCGGAFALATS